MRRITFLWALGLGAMAPASCRQVTGLDQFQVQCAPGDEDCLTGSEFDDCVAGVDTNGDGVLPAECSGKAAWVRVTPAAADKQCPDNNGMGGTYTINGSKKLTAMASFGAWSGALSTLRGELWRCEDTCALEAWSFDSAGEAAGFQPSLPCDDTGVLFQALARGSAHAFAAGTDRIPSRFVALSKARLDDGSFASRWEWQPPEDITAVSLAADTSAVVAVGQTESVALVDVDSSFLSPRFHKLDTARVPSLALTQANKVRTLLLAGYATSSTDPGPCGVGASAATAYVARAQLPLLQGSSSLASAATLKCTDHPVKLAVGGDTQSPSMKIAALPNGRACWAYLGSDANDKRRLRTGCFDLRDPAFGWKQEAVIGNHVDEAVGLALDPFGHVLISAAIAGGAAASLWGGASVPPASADDTNLLVLKLHADTGEVVWGHMFAAPQGNLRNPQIAANDDGSVQIGAITDGPALVGPTITQGASSNGIAAHFVGLLP